MSSNVKEKIREIYTTLEEVNRNISTDKERFKEFLISSSKNYKCTYQQQLLIYNQCPESTAVHTFDGWKNHFKRYVKKGAKGIAVPNIERAYGKNEYAYLFDISATDPRQNSINVPIWQREDSDNTAIIQTLGNKYGIDVDSEEFSDYTLDEVIEFAVDISCQYNFADYILENQQQTETDTNNHAEATIYKGVLATIYGRLGLSTNQIEFDELENLTESEYFNVMGAINEISKELLLNISQTIQTNQSIAPQTAEVEITPIEHDDEVYFEPLTNDNIKALNEQITFEMPVKIKTVEVVEPIKKTEVINPVIPQVDFYDKQLKDDIDTSQYLGRILELNGRKFIVEKMDKTNSSLRDITFQANVGIPIWRGEPSHYIVDCINEIDRKKNDKKSKGENFRIEDNAIGVGTPRERYKNNIDAIKVLKACQEENSIATKVDQEVLSKYVGWGGLAEAFDETKWGKEYLELKTLLTEDEYTAARESTLTAFYTQPVVVNAMYEAISNMGFTKGNILEPSCGIGNFIGRKPTNLNDSKVYGVELDSISGRISKLLYPQENIQVKGFEQTKFSDNFFDVAIGNVPFGDFKVPDSKYNKHNFQIHDYFFAKSLDKVRSGGVIAFITSQGTMDKMTARFRKYLCEKAELLGAIRLPDDTFSKSAGTKVTSDIIFLQKRDRQNLVEESWVNTSKYKDELQMNNYFIENPEMILGEMKVESGPFGPQLNCKAIDGATLEEQLHQAIKNIHGKIEFVEQETDIEDIDTRETLPADDAVKNFSFTTVDDKIFYRENSVMVEHKAPLTTQNRIKGMIDLRNMTRQLIEYQLNDYSDDLIKESQKQLDKSYNTFTKKYGYINLSANSNAFNDDSSYCLLCSLETPDREEKDKYNKATIFTKRTIKPKEVVTKVDTPIEALVLSVAEKTKVDLEYMSQLTDKTSEELITELRGVIFKEPRYDDNEIYLTSEEYLSGNVREKLSQAQFFAKDNKQFDINVQALENVIPKDLTASEISIRVGATWVPVKNYQEFMEETFKPNSYAKDVIKVQYSKNTSQWNITRKTADLDNITATSKYGTKRSNGYKLFEESLNLREARVYMTKYDHDGKEVRVVDKEETSIAVSKQALIAETFKDWVWKDPTRREQLVRLYNDNYNNIRPREYHGGDLAFVGMNNEITLKPHQKDAVAHILYGGNTLLAHVVGSGKTFEMVAAAQESKRLGLCNKSLFVVPNHLTEQWAGEYMQLYPSANILVATKKDFETKNRKKFVSRIATGDYDAVIIGHTQFEKIPMSIERQEIELNRQKNEVLTGIAELKSNNGERFSIKAMERTRKGIEAKLKKLNDASRKDDVITFEELGVDRLFVDEAHYYKNCAIFTKMRNVGGIAQTEAQKSSDLFMKCRYLDEVTGGRGIIFATGTPISNSMVEMYTMQRYLQYGKLQEKGLNHFDNWASTFGETQTTIELAPEGVEYEGGLLLL